MAFKRYNHLNVPESWERYWTKYPQGMTILESLFEWVSQVDNMVDNQNKLNDNVEQFRNEIDAFVERFDERLQDEVTQTLNDWQNSGFLDVVISEALQWELDNYIATNEQDKLSLTTQLAQIAYIQLTPQGANDTALLQSSLENYKTIDLNGETFYTNELIVPTGTILQNGTLIGIDTTVVLKATNAKDITIKNITVDGQNICEGGLFFEECESVKIENCHVKNFKTRAATTYGIFLDKCTNSIVSKTSVTNVNAVANTIIGDEVGTSRGILFADVTYSRIEQCTIKNIMGDDDADGIHLNTRNSLNGFNTVMQNKVSNCQSRMIKIQQPSNTFSFNQLVTEGDYSLTTEMRVAGVSIYADNIVFDSNYIRVQSLRPLQLGAGNALRNITITNNRIEGYFGSGQASIVLSDAPLLSNVSIVNNTIIGNSSDRSGIDIRTFFNNVRISNNEIKNVIYGVLIRPSDGLFQEGVSVRVGLVVTDNNVAAINHLVVGNALTEDKDTVTRFICANNTVHISSVISYLPNSVNLSSAQYGKKPIVNGNSLSGVWIDGQPKTGSTDARPTNVGIGYVYFDQTIGKPIWWNGSFWIDSANVTV